jgi:hypothetical protein
MEYIHQNLEEIITSANSEQKILWNEILLRFGEKIAVRPIYYEGAITGSEFATYIANKTYLSLYSVVTTQGYGSSSPWYVELYNHLNASKAIYSNNVCYWDATAAAARFVGNTLELKNVYFHRLDKINYTTLIFKGFRIIY